MSYRTWKFLKYGLKPNYIRNSGQSNSAAVGALGLHMTKPGFNFQHPI